MGANLKKSRVSPRLLLHPLSQRHAELAHAAVLRPLPSGGLDNGLTFTPKLGKAKVEKTGFFTCPDQHMLLKIFIGSQVFKEVLSISEMGHSNKMIAF